MKRNLVVFAAIIMAGVGCSKQDIATETEFQPTAERKECASHDVLEQQLAVDPTFRKNLANLDEITRKLESGEIQMRISADGNIEIPVVFNVIYRTTAENVPLSRLQSQIDVLNDDYSATNSDYNSTPAAFQSARSGDVGIRFVLDAVYRKKTNKSSWSTNDAMKGTQGIRATSPTTKLNIWVCNMGGGILGYAQFPGGNPATDGVVLDDAATGVLSSGVYNLGRTATHEVGHWLNLRHIWGDDGTGCTGSDQVADTPNQGGSNGGCPTFPKISCSNTPNGDMFMNYMDYTYDRCMYMFTAGQKTRMLATFAAGGPRSSFAQ